MGGNFLHARIPDVTMTNLKFPSGIGGHIFVSWLNPYKEQKLVIVGSNGMLVFDDTEPVETKLVLYPHTINWQDGIPIPQKAEHVLIDLKPIWKEPLRAECEAYLSAMQTGTLPYTCGEEGLRVLKVLEASQKSLEQKESSLPKVRKTESVEQNTDFFIHETAIVDAGVEIGKGTKIWHFSHVLSGSKIGVNCNIGQNVVVGADVTIGNQCKIQNNVSVYKGVTLEDGVFCGPSMVFTNIYNPRAEIYLRWTMSVPPSKERRHPGSRLHHCLRSYDRQLCLRWCGSGRDQKRPQPCPGGGQPSQTDRLAGCICGERLTNDLHCTACGNEYKKTDDEGYL